MGVGLAAVSDMYDACASNTASCSAVANFLDVSTFAELAALSEYVSPFQMLDETSAVITDPRSILVVHGSSDGTVLPVQSSNLVTEANNYPNINVEPLPFTSVSGEGHFDVIDPTSTSWTTRVIPFLEDQLVVLPVLLLTFRAAVLGHLADRAHLELLLVPPHVAGPARGSPLGL